MIRALYRTPDGTIRVDIKPEAFPALLQDRDALLWVDFLEEPPEVCEPILRQVFAFHPLAVDDAIQESHVPKLDDWGEYLYLVFHAVLLDESEGLHLDTREMDVFLGSNYVVTYHPQPIAALDRVFLACQRDERHLRKGPDHLLYRIVDELATRYMLAAEAMDEALDRIEDAIFDRPTPATLEQIFRIKRALLHMRQILTPQREVLNKLARDDYTVVDADARIFFRDVYDHLVRLHDINESMRDLVGGALETYLSTLNNRMNDIMKTLTIITTLFMPISFLAGFFGMNFFQPFLPLPAWTGKWAFSLVLALTILTPIGMSLWIRRRGWM